MKKIEVIKSIFKGFWSLIKFCSWIFIFLGCMTTVLTGLLGLVMEPGSMFVEGANTLFIAAMLVPTGFAGMIYVANKAFDVGRMQSLDWEMFEEGKRMTRSDSNLLLGIQQETTVICDIYRRPRGNGTYEYKTVERHN